MRGPMTHPETEVLAEFRAGIVTGRRGAAIAAHLAGCDRCSAADRGLAEVSALLAAVPGPAMPEGVARRLDTVLAAEAEQRIRPERAGADSPPERPAPGLPWPGKRGSRLLTLRVLAPAAAVVALAAGGYGLSQIGSGPATQTAASSSAGRAAKSVAGPAEPAAYPPSGGASARRALAPAAYLAITTSDVNFVPATHRQQLEAVMRAPEGTLRPASAQTRACVQNVAGRANVARVMSARYNGHPATVIVTRSGQRDTAWVTGPNCSAGHRDLLASALLPPGI
jgi:hypothetical protein